MITQEDLAALVELLNRVALSKAERLWLQAFIQRCADQIQPTTSKDAE